MSAGHHPDVMNHLKIGPQHIEKLVKHIFRAPHHQHLVEKYFPTQKFMKVELPPPTVRNLLFYPPF